MAPLDAAPDQRFPRERRLRSRSDFSNVYSRGRSWAHPLLLVRVLPNQRPVTRFGFAVGKRVGGAVVRNLLKRRIREAVRRLPVRPGYDVLVIGRPPAAGSSYGPIEAAVTALLGRSGLLHTEGAADALPRP